MKNSTFYFVLTIGLLLMGAVAWWGMHMHGAPQPQAAPTSSTSTDTATSTHSLSGLSIYTNGDYGFSLAYPSTYTATTTFTSTYNLQPTWSIFGTTKNGTPLIEIIGYKVENKPSFPRYYEAEVRVGVSNDPRMVASCTKVSNGEITLPNKVINGVTWHGFLFHDAAMMQYVAGTIYTTVHDQKCFALEQLETGSSYRDTPSPADIPQATLNKHYADLMTIINSFTFARP